MTSALVPLLCPGVRRTSRGTRLCRRPLSKIPRTWLASLELHVLEDETQAAGSAQLLWCRGCEHWVEIIDSALRVA